MTDKRMVAVFHCDNGKCGSEPYKYEELMMVKVYCTFNECLFNKPHDEDYGICTKDHITLDELVSGRTCGCPDAEWDEPQSLEQFRAGLEYHTDTTHFGKVKGKSVTTNTIEDEQQTDYQ